MMRTRVQVYSEEECVEDFGEGEEDCVELARSIDDGSLIMSDSQNQEAYAGAVGVTQASSSQSGFSCVDLGLSTSLTPAAPLPPPTLVAKATPHKRARGSDVNDTDAESEDDDVAPFAETFETAGIREKMTTL